MSEIDKNKVMYDLTIGRYRFVYFRDGTRPMAFRHGEPWDAMTADMLGSKAIMSLVTTLCEARDLLADIEGYDGAEGFSDSIRKRMDEMKRFVR